LNPLASLLEERDTREPWFCEPKDKDPASELQRVQTFLRMLGTLGPRCIVWAVPNAAKRTMWQAGQAKREGMKPGVPDLTICFTGGVFFAEFKDGKSMPSVAQCEMLDRLYRAEQPCGVFRQPTTLINHLRHLGAPIAKART
jgi:hypothetical protein